MMHPLLQRILRKSQLGEKKLPDNEKAWNTLLERLDQALRDCDRDRYLLESSSEVSSRETKDLPESSTTKYRRRLNALLSVIPDLILYLDEEGHLLDVFSEGEGNVFSYMKEELIGKSVEEVFGRKQSGPLRPLIEKALRSGTLQILEFCMPLDGQRRYFEIRIMPTNYMEEGRRTLIAIVRDVSIYRRHSEYLNMVQKIFEDATEGIVVVSLDGKEMEANRAFYRMFGIEKKDLNELHKEQFKRFFDERTFRKILKRIETEEYFHGEVTIYREGRDALFAWLTIDTVHDDHGNPIYRVGMLTDISELEKSRKELQYVATHDAVTGLPNRSFLFEHLNEALARSERSGREGALLFIDLDKFKEINDTAGHDAGDQALIACSRRIRRILRRGDFFGRLGGDEFLAILENIDNVDSPRRVAEKIIQAIRRPMRLKGHTFELGASIGIALFPQDSRDPSTLIRYADMAMYRAKKAGGNRFTYYSPSFNDDAQRHYRVERELIDALKNDGFTLLYQPQLDLPTGKICGVEALVRLSSTELGVISPEEFIPIAEENHIILRLGEWIFEEACRQIVQWREEGIEIPVAINLSRRQLADKSLYDFVESTLERYGVEGSSLEFEITETTFMDVEQGDHHDFERFQKLGIRFSIDDFGTGFSSLANLKEFPVDKLKIDRSFVREMLERESDRVIVEASIALSKALGLRSIAEGVETEEQKRYLQEEGCDEMQGYFFSRPVPPEEIGALLRRQSR